MQQINILNFKGLQTGKALPEIGTAKDLKNFVRHKVRGALQLTNGYDRKVFGEIAVTYSGGNPVIATSADPHGLHENEIVIAKDSLGAIIGTYQITVTGIDTLTLDGTTGAGSGTGTLQLISLPQNDSGVPKISGISIVDVKNFKIAEQGGRNITVVVGTYTKNGYQLPSAVDVTRMGVWINPWYDQENSVWVEGWQELTEMWQFQIRELLGGPDDYRLFIDSTDGLGNWDFDFRNVVDPNGTYFTDNYPYFKGWTIVYDDFGDDENYDKVIYSGFQSDVYYLAVPRSVTTTFGSRVVGTNISVYRNFCTKELPSDIETWIVKLFNEIRLTTGRTASDVSLFAGWSAKTFETPALAWDGVLPNYNGEVLNGIYAGDSGFDQWDYAIAICMTSTNNAAGLPIGTYYLKFALVREDGQEDLLRDISTGTATPFTYAETGSNNITLAAAAYINLFVGRSLGALPRWARYVRVYISTDDVTYNRIKDIDLTDTAVFDSTVTTAPAILIGTVTKADASTIEHVYCRSTEVRLANTDYLAIGAEASVDLGRSAADAGWLPHKVRQIVGQKSLIANCLVSGLAVPNKVFVSAANGDGDMQYDVNPNSGSFIVDVEYNDGDEVVGIAPTTGDRFIVMKRRRLVLVEPNGRGGYNRIVLAENIGLTSQKAVATRDARSYFPDYNGLYSYSPNGLKLLNAEWLEDWKAVSAADKEAAVSVFDVQNNMWMLFCGAKVYKYDLIDGEWTIDEFEDAVVAVAEDLELPTGIDFVGDGKLNTLGADVLMDNVSFSGEWESNKIEPSASQPGQVVDVLLQFLQFEYESDVAITVNVYLDDSASAWGDAFTLSASEKKATLAVALGARCKGFRVKVSATRSADGQDVLIKKCYAYYQLVGTTRNALTA